jgi:hypothetical protein
MTIDQIIAWAETKNCNDRRRTGACQHDACDENDRVIAVLRTARRFVGTDQDGRDATGWLIPEA